MAKVHINMGNICIELDENDKTCEELLQLGSPHVLMRFDRAVKYENAQAMEDEGEDGDDPEAHPESKRDIKLPDVLRAGGMFA